MYVRVLQPITATFTSGGTTFQLDQHSAYKILPLWVAQDAGFQSLWTALIVQVATDSAFVHIITTIPDSELGGGGGGGSVAWTAITGKPSTFPPVIGATSTTAAAGNDSRLSDARTPLDSSVTIGKVAGSTLVTATETIAANNNDSTIPTSAAVKAYADSLGIGGGGGAPADGTVTTTKVAPTTLVTAAEGIRSNNNDTTLPTSAAVKAYADSVANQDTVVFGYCQSELAHGSYGGFDTEAKIRAVLQGIKDSGALYVRVAAWWNVIEPTLGGGYTWTGMNNFLNWVGDYGLIPIVCITAPAPTGATITAYGSLCAAIATRYGSAGTGQLKYYEIWNEENNISPAAPFNTGATPFGPATYASLLIAGATGVRAHDPQALILFGGTMSTADYPPTGSKTDYFPSTFLQGVIDNGGGAYFDIFNVHWYAGAVDFSGWLEPSSAHPVYADLPTCRQILIDNGMGAKPFWLTEMGLPIIGAGLDNPAQRANWMVEQIELVRDLGFIDVWFIFNYENAPSLPTAEKFGVLSESLVKYQPIYDTIANINAVTPRVPKGSVGMGELAASGTPSSATYLRGDGAWSTPSGSGDTSTSTTVSVDSEVAVFSGTTGKLLKRATLTGIPKMISGVISAAVAGTDYTTPTSTESPTNKNLSSGTNVFPTLNQNTTGSAARWTTARTVDGQALDGTANITVIAPGTHAAASKLIPADADEFPMVDSAAGNVLKKGTWANIKAAWNSAVKVLLNTTLDAAGTGNVISNLGTTNFALTALVTASETIGSNNNDTTIPTSAAVKAYADLVGGGGGGSAPTPYVALVGAMSADSTNVITHGLNTWNVGVVLTRSYLQTGALTLAVPGEVVSDIRWRKLAGNPNAIVLEPSVATAANEFIIAVNPSPAPADTVGPTAGTISSPAQGLTTVDLLLTGGTDAGIGNAGVNWYRGGSLVGTSPGNTFTDTGLTNTTAYSYTAKRFDYFGTEGAVSNTITPSTLTPSNVAVIGTVSQNRSASTGIVSVIPIYPAGSLTMSVAIVEVSHSQWIVSEASGAATANYSLVVNGTQSSGWTRYYPTANGIANASAPDIGAGGGQQSGGVHVFYKMSPSTSWTTDSVTFTASGSAITPAQSCITIFHLAFVDQTTPFNAVAARGQGTASPLSIGVASALGDLTIIGYAMHHGNGAPIGYNKTQLGSTQGLVVVAGYAHDLLCGYSPTTLAGTITHTTSGPLSSADAAILLNVKKA